MSIDKDEQISRNNKDQVETMKLDRRTFTSDIDQPRVHYRFAVLASLKTGGSSILCNLVKIVLVLSPFAGSHGSHSISHGSEATQKIGKSRRIVTAVHVTLIHWDHKRSLYKFHPLYEVLCAGEI